MCTGHRQALQHIVGAPRGLPGEGARLGVLWEVSYSTLRFAVPCGKAARRSVVHVCA